MADFSKPVSTDSYANVLSYLKATTSDLALGLDPATTSPTNVPTNAVRWSSVSAKWQKWNGTTWNDLASSYAINISGTAAGLSATLAIASGGTGATTAAAALVSLGERTGANGSTKLPTGTAAQRDSTPAAGFIRFNTDSAQFEGYNGSAWTSVGGGGNPIYQLFSGDGSTTAFMLSNTPGSLASLEVFISGVRQRPGTDYTWSSGTTLTFTSAPPAGANNIFALWGNTLTINTPSDGSISTAKIADGAVTPSKLSTGAPTWNTSGNLGVGTASPGGKVEIANNGFFALRLNNTSGSGWKSEIIWCGAGTAKWAAGCDFANAGYNNFYLYDSVAGAQRLGIDTSGNLQFNSGYGSVAIAYGCRAWVNFNGTGSIGANQTIRGAGNVSSVYKNGTGDYTINFANAMPDANYSVSWMAAKSTDVAPRVYASMNSAEPPTSTSVRLRCGDSTNGILLDTPYGYVSIFR